MITIYAIHPADDNKLALIIEEMKELGPPEIKVVDCGDHYVALEGSHRLAAAAELQLSPNLKIYRRDDLIDINGFDWFDDWNWAGTRYAGAEVVSEIFSPYQAVPYRFSPS